MALKNSPDIVGRLVGAICLLLLVACIVLRNTPSIEIVGDAAFFALLAFAIIQLVRRTST